MAAPSPYRKTYRYDYALTGMKLGVEAHRLSIQYDWIKDVYDHPNLCPESIDLSKVNRVIDVACGTGEWIRDLARLPAIQQRATPAEIYACDISFDSLQLTRKEIDSLGVNVFLQDMTKPFPAEMLGTFDLVHASILAYCLTGEGWKTVLENLSTLIRPGGFIYLMEFDNNFAFPGLPYPPVGQPHDFEKMMSGNTVPHMINSIYTGISTQRGFLGGLSYQLGPLVTSAGIAIVSSVVVDLPIGNMCNSTRSLRGADLRHQIENGVEDGMLVLDCYSKAMLERGSLECPIGVSICTEAEREALMTQFEGVLREGALVRTCEWVGKKP